MMWTDCWVNDGLGHAAYICLLVNAHKQSKTPSWNKFPYLVFRWNKASGAASLAVDPGNQ